MLHLRLTEGDSGRRLPFYLAMEEWAARFLTDFDEIFFMWQVKPTVIMGRNQDADVEIDLTYCREHGIDVVRRKSGGGCVFADMSNIMFSYITTSDNVVDTFASYTERVAAFLRSLDIPAEAGSRNDVLINGRKVSGNAFFHIPGRAIAHGTMLYDFDPRHIARAITPARAKLASKGVTSVASHLCTVREFRPDIPIADFKRRAADFMTSSTLTLSPSQVAEIEEMAREYNDDAWTYGRRRRQSSETRSKRIEGLGDFHADILTADGRITAMTLTGDFFTTADPEALLLPRLKGAPLTPEGIRHALTGFDPSEAIPGLDTETLIRILS